MLHQRVVDQSGERKADVLMELLPPVGWAEVATKSDLDALSVATKSDLQVLEYKLQSGFHRDLIRQTWIFVGTVIAAMGAIAGVVGAS